MIRAVITTVDHVAFGTLVNPTLELLINGKLLSFRCKLDDDATALSIRSRSTAELPISENCAKDLASNPYGFCTPSPVASALLQCSMSIPSDTAVTKSTEMASDVDPEIHYPPHKLSTRDV